MSEKKIEQERAYQDGSWHWVIYSGLHKVYGAPAMYKANCDTWCSLEFSDIPTRYVEVVGQCVPYSLPVGVPDGYALVPVEPTPEMLEAADRYHDTDEYANSPDDVTNAECYQVMLAAAPAAQPAAEQSPTTKESLTVAEQSAPGEVEEVEVVAYLSGTSGLCYGEPYGLEQAMPLMTVAQHKRIVAQLGALLAQREREGE